MQLDYLAHQYPSFYKPVNFVPRTTGTFPVHIRMGKQKDGSMVDGRNPSQEVCSVVGICYDLFYSSQFYP